MQLRKANARASEGFTLMEVLVAMTLITLVIGGGITALIQGNRMVEDARDVTRVSQVIQSEIEDLRTKNWDDLAGLVWTAQVDGADPNLRFYPYYQRIPLQGQFAEKYGDKYTLWRGVFFQDMDSDGTEDQIGVYVWVGWQPQRGRYYKWQRYYTRFTQDGLNDYYYRAFPSE